MRRTPFYAYPSFPHSAFYAHPGQSDHHRPLRPFSPASPPSASSAPRSVINVPVFDSLPNSSPPHAASLPPAASLVRRRAPTIQDPSSAATTIQAHFRGFRVRRHRPLLHLRSIAKARKQLQDLQAELDSAAFALKLKADEKERLRFNESVMAIILRLDAIEGSMAEVRSQRKEATKMAIKLQDAIDAITVQKDESVDDLSKSNDGPSSDITVAQEDDPILREQLEQNSGPSGSNAPTDNGVREQDEFASAKGVDGVTEGMQNVQSDDIEMDFEEKMGPSLPPSGSADVDQPVEANCFNPFPQVLQHHEEMDNTGLHVKAGNDTLCVSAAEEEVSNGMEGLHLVGSENSLHDTGDLVAKLIQGNCKDVAHLVGSVDDANPSGLYTCSNMDVGEDGKEESGDCAEFYPAVDEVEYDKPSDSDAAHCDVCQDPSTAERQTDGTCSVDSLDSATLQMHGCENRSHEAFNACDAENSACDKVTAHLCTLPARSVPSLEAAHPQLLGQLSEDCKQLKLLVGKLLVQNKAQSKVLCALTDRLEQLEHQQQLFNCQRNQQQMREKRKRKKGSKRSVRCRGNCE